MRLPDDRRYTKDYSWVKIQDTIAIIGIAQPAADKVEEFVFIKLPKTGQSIKRGETYVSVEALKWSGHLSRPVSGTITDVNQALFDEPSLINDKPYQSWIIKVQMDNPAEVDTLLDADAAQKWYEETQ